MHCWIGVADEEGRRIVRLAGRFCEDQVPDLLETCGNSAAVTLDLTDLVYVDDVGLDALQRMRMRGARLVGAPRYIQLKLDSTARMRPASRSSNG